MKETESLMKSLIGIKSVTGEEGQLRSFVHQWLSSNGIPVIKQNSNLVVAFCNNNPNGLMFNAHMDTVTPGDISNWRYPPFGEGSGVIKNKKMYGLGASDEDCAAG